MPSPLELIQQPVADALAEAVRVFDAELASELPFVRDLCTRAAAYRGKMLRPTLLLLSAKACGEIRREHIVLAAVVEMVHVATLVHDDVLDEADTRRNAPTVNHRGGNEIAVLLGDFLISHSYHLCTSIGSTDAARAVAAATNRVCEGEMMQVHHRGRWDMDEATYFEIIKRKTAELTRLACELGARRWGRPAAESPSEIHRLKTCATAEFGENIGIAFQIIDDLLDITASESEIGKTPGRDVDMEKPTLPIIHALKNGDEGARAELKRVLGTRDAERGNALAALLERTCSLAYAAEAARRHVKTAQERLGLLPASAARDAMMAAAEFTLVRRK